MNELVANGHTNAQAYGTYLATRYGTAVFPHVLWLLGGDYGSGQTSRRVHHGQHPGRAGAHHRPHECVGAEADGRGKWSDPSDGVDAATVGPLMTLSGAYASAC